MCGQLYCRHAVVSALGSKLDDLGSSPGWGRVLCPWVVRGKKKMWALLLGLAKSIYYFLQMKHCGLTMILNTLLFPRAVVGQFIGNQRKHERWWHAKWWYADSDSRWRESSSRSQTGISRRPCCQWKNPWSPWNQIWWVKEGWNRICISGRGWLWVCCKGRGIIN